MDHALKGQPQLGDPLARIAHLSALDLSEDKETVARLLKALRDQLPLRVLGFAIPRRHEAAVHLIRALSGTPAPAVHHAFDELVRRFPDTEFADAASKALASFGASARPPEQAATTLSGDLELFGLPNLLQSLAESEVSGVLMLTDTNGEPVGTLNFEGGRLRDCHVGALHGEAAVYQLFENPKPGSFVLRSRRDGASDAELTQPPMEVLPVILEAVRRHDELRKSRAIVPDERLPQADRDQAHAAAGGEGHQLPAGPVGPGGGRRHARAVRGERHRRFVPGPRPPRPLGRGRVPAGALTSGGEPGRAPSPRRRCPKASTAR